MKKLFVFLFVITVSFGFSQEDLNKYKYMIIPKKFDAFKKENQYKTSTLVKYLFSNNGFNAVYDDALPEDLKANRCLGLKVSVDNRSSMFTTKTALVLKDCNSQEVLHTIIGNSKEKEYESAYREALTEAFGTIKALDYKYSPDKKKKKAMADNVKGIKEVPQPKNKTDERVVKQVATPENQMYKSAEPVVSKIKKEGSVGKKKEINERNSRNILYAQKITNGYQLVDSTPEICLKIYHTSAPNVFTVIHDEDNGVVFKKEGKWYLEYYLDDVLKTEELNIKF